MKTISSIFLFLICFELIAQDIKETPIKTTVSEATVFINGAQVVRKKSVEIPAGKSTLKFVELSPYIDAKSLKVRVNGEVMVLSVNHQFNYVDSAARSNELKDLDAKIKVINDKLQIENANQAILNEETSFLRDNHIIGGKNQEVSLVNLKETAIYYKERTTALKMGEIEIAKNIETLSNQNNALQQQRNQLVYNNPTPVSEVLVKIDAKTATKCDFELSYLVKNAGWFPTYDIRANSIDEPIELIYKANIRQSTKEDWKNIKLKLSSSDPSTGSIAPQLQTYYLNYNSRPPKYNATSNQVYGRIVDANSNEAMPGVTISIIGTTIGTVSDINGNYTLAIPNNSCQLQYSFIGYETRSSSITGQNMNIALTEAVTNLDDVVVVGYGVQKKSYGEEVKAAPAMRRASKSMAIKSSISIPMEQSETTTSVEFEIKTPYTINSDNKNLTIDIDSYNLDASFEYYCVPKVDKDAFLIANIVNWEKLNLLAGEANIFFENTFVGKSILDTRYMSDTLNLSLGRDRNVMVKRDKLKDFTTKQFIGNKKEENRAWQISVKNNKKSAIEMTLFDQVPVSTLEEIEVTVENVSGAQFNKESGEVKWKLKLEPSAKKELELKYKVKYPKDRNLIIE